LNSIGESGCASRPCIHNSTCETLIGVNPTSAYRCHCRTGYTGRNCETRKFSTIKKNNFISLNFSLGDPCVPNPCKNNGRCRPNVAGGTYVCECPPNFVGTNCETSKFLA